MGRLKQVVEPEVTTEVTVEISPKLKKKVQIAIDLYADLVRQRKDIEKRIKLAAEAIEVPFHDAGESEALSNGVKVGDVSVKWIDGQESKTLNKAKLMKRYKMTPEQFEAFYDKKPKAAYLYVGLPKDKGED
jgi:hypothetical protein